MGPPCVILVDPLVGEYQPASTGQLILEPGIYVLLVITGIALLAEISDVEVAEILVGTAGVSGEPVRRAVAHFEPIDVGALRARVTVVRIAVESFYRIEIVVAAREHLHGSAYRIAAVKHRRRSTNNLHPADAERIDSVPVLVGPVAKHRVVQPDSVNQQQVTKSGETANKRRPLTVRRFLNHDSRQFTQGLWDRPDLAFLAQRRVSQRAHRERRVADRQLRSGGRNDDLIELLRPVAPRIRPECVDAAEQHHHRNDPNYTSAHYTGGPGFFAMAMVARPARPRPLPVQYCYCHERPPAHDGLCYYFLLAIPADHERIRRDTEFQAKHVPEFELELSNLFTIKQ